MRRHRLDAVPAQARAGIRRLRDDLGLPAHFSPEAVAQAERLRAHPPKTDAHADWTHVEFVTIDPASSMDLDQALHIERVPGGYRVRYAIADVGHWVEPGSPLDAEAHRRGETFYAPGARIPLHPPALSEDAASLLADGRPRPAIVWTHLLDERGQTVETTLTRALVLNRAKLDYSGVQRDLDAGRAHPSIALLPEVGRLRQRLEMERGGINLRLPEQEIVEVADGWDLVFRALHPVEAWNAQISLLTGFRAARLQVDGAVGILRVLPPAEDFAIARLRRQARAVGVDWPQGLSYPDFVRGLSPERPRELAVLVKCTMLFRGAGYALVGGEGGTVHSALGTQYAHVTAPLRRLVDRYALEACLALAEGREVPDWVLAALPELPATMRRAGTLANAYERGVMSIAEALELANRVGESFDGVLVDVHPKTGRGLVQIAEPAVELQLQAEQRDVGKTIRVRIERVDVDAGEVQLARLS